MAKQQRERCSHFPSTIRLHGYPAYERGLSGWHPANWIVDLELSTPGARRIVSLGAFESYDEALARYRQVTGV